MKGGESEKTEAVAALTKLLGEDHLMASAGEWGLLFAFLKNGPDDGDIALTDVREMFVAKQVPDGWKTWEKSALSGSRPRGDWSRTWPWRTTTEDRGDRPPVRDVAAA